MSHRTTLLIALRGPCHCCGGEGWMTSTQKCGVCEGTGQCGRQR